MLIEGRYQVIAGILYGLHVTWRYVTTGAY
jgi:hypothetical protein